MKVLHLDDSPWQVNPLHTVMRVEGGYEVLYCPTIDRAREALIQGPDIALLEFRLGETLESPTTEEFVRAEFLPSGRKFAFFTSDWEHIPSDLAKKAEFVVKKPASFDKVDGALKRFAAGVRKDE